MREETTRLLLMGEVGTLSWESIARAALAFTPEEDVEELVEDYGWGPYRREGLMREATNHVLVSAPSLSWATVARGTLNAMREEDVIRLAESKGWDKYTWEEEYEEGEDEEDEEDYGDEDEE